MKDGIRSHATPAPLTAPIAPVIARIAGTPHNSAGPDDPTQPKVSTPPSVIIEATLRSRPPTMTTICCPNDTTATKLEMTRIALIWRGSRSPGRAPARP